MKKIIPNEKELNRLLSIFKEEGAQSLYVVSDFDRTLTYGTVDGVDTPSIISLLRDGNHLTDSYAQKAQNLFNKYHPVEIDPTIPLQKKKEIMREWWETHNQLLIKSGLEKADLEDIVHSKQVRFRKGVEPFLDFLVRKKIPLIIFSASGCGDAIKLMFQQIKRDYSNIHYITNQFNWNQRGKAVSTKGKLIHSFNKDETVLDDYPIIRNAVAQKKNVFLLGDSLGDIGMIQNTANKRVIKVGFLNSHLDKLIGEYQQQFDIIFEGDGDFEMFNKIIFSTFS